AARRGSTARATGGGAGGGAARRPAAFRQSRPSRPRVRAPRPATRAVDSRAERPPRHPLCGRRPKSSRERPPRVRAGAAAGPPPPVHERLILDEGLEVAPAQRVAQLAERLGLDLPDALARHREALADLFERVLPLFADAEPEAQDLLLLRRQRGQRALDLGREVLTHQRVVGRAGRLVL